MDKLFRIKKIEFKTSCFFNIIFILKMSYIRYVDAYDKEIKIDYDNNVLEINLSWKGIKQIIEIVGLDKLQILNLSYNQIRIVGGLDELKQLQRLDLSENKIRIVGGLNELKQLQKLNLSSNQIKVIEGLDELKQLQILNLSYNQIEVIEGLNELKQLQELYLYQNQIRIVSGLDELKQLQILYLAHNQIGIVGELDELKQLQKLNLSNNKIKIVEGLDELKQLQKLDLYNNQITVIPLSIMNLKNLNFLFYDTNKIQLNQIIQRFLNRNKLKTNKLSIYNDSQNVHDSEINTSIRDSIYAIMNDTLSITFDELINLILDDSTLVDITKSSLIYYSNNEDVHSVLNVSFKDVLIYVWNIIIKHKDKEQIKLILNDEMKDSLCKCFTGRLSRLINCLNGFDDRIKIKISDSNEISNIIILVRNKYENYNEQVKYVTLELKERGYSDEIINEWISYLE